jgi:hypothetical protein
VNTLLREQFVNNACMDKRDAISCQCCLSRQASKSVVVQLHLTPMEMTECINQMTGVQKESVLLFWNRGSSSLVLRREDVIWLAICTHSVTI